MTHRAGSLCLWHEEDERPRTGQVFVFGSNLAGQHVAGVALLAHERFGAVLGVGVGYQGSPPAHCYAIPTKDERLGVLPLDVIRRYVDEFVEFAHDNPQLTFFITRIGCGAAGYRDAQIAPLFQNAPPGRCSFARSWRPYLTLRSGWERKQNTDGPGLVKQSGEALLMID